MDEWEWEVLRLIQQLSDDQKEIFRAELEKMLTETNTQEDEQ